ncbi:MAG TPA: hypothetical protein VM029_10710 [Opitutaceae bacterium]|nr:hypothetical protein [Opitutaceae bacterium]
MVFRGLPLCLVAALALAFTGAPVVRAAPPKLLEDAVEKWLGERDHWAFTQRAIEYESEKPHERLERYDPSLPAERRWTLLAIDGKPPTEDQRAAWAKKKFKKNRRKFESPIGDLFDFTRARIVGETPKMARYDVPLRTDKSWLFPVDKVRVIVTVNKENRALEHLTADVREPFKVLLGLAKITGGGLDLSFEDDDGTPGPDTAPTGTARVTVSKFGERAEFTWTDFKRVTPVGDSPGKAVGATGR